MLFSYKTAGYSDFINQILRYRAVKLLPLPLLALWLLTGCAAVTVEPPRQVAEPVPVFLLDHGRHSSLVLPAGDGRMARYSYGDWEYYALRRTGLATGLAALFGPTPAALGRSELAGPPTEEVLRAQVRIVVERIFEIEVEAAAADRLRTELDTIFETALESRIHSAGMDVEFVHHPVPYTFGHNSNRVVAGWLEALGCTITGRPILSNWKIATD